LPLDAALGLSNLAGAVPSEYRRGTNTRHLLTGLFRQSMFGRLAGHEDVNDAERLAHDPVVAKGPNWWICSLRGGQIGRSSGERRLACP
jgi:hypothetical protein